MSDYFFGEIRWFPFDWTPKGWLPCDGRSLSINVNQGLYSLLGMTYGGSQTNQTFNLPDLRGRAPVHIAPNQPGYALGSVAGTETVALTVAEMPTHNHMFKAVGAAGTIPTPAGSFLAQGTQPADITAPALLYGPITTAAAIIPLNNGNVTQAGGGQAHQNMQPYLVLNPCIATSGVYPTRS